MADVIQRVCDACNLDDEMTASNHSVHLTVSGSDYRLDLCQEHWQDVWIPVVRVLDGAISNPRPHEQEWICPDCDEPQKTISSLSRHRNTAHGFAPYNLETGCPYCSRQKFGNIQLLSAHIHYLHRDEHITRMTTERSR